MEQTNEPKQLLNIPTAIVVAGAIIAGAIIWTSAPNSPGSSSTQEDVIEYQLRPVSSEDHILRNPDAKLKIVEYSDTSCPFCKIFHNTLKKIMEDYGTSGNVAWVYRHYPLDKADASGNILHPNAGVEAQALECAAEQGGNEKFWAYTHRLYEITPSVTSVNPNGLSRTELPKIAEYVGLNVNDFNNCLSTGKYATKVEADFTEGVNVGVQGTPSSILIVKKAFPVTVKEKLMQLYEPYKNPQTGEYPISISSDSKMIRIGGAMPIEVMKATVELLFTY